MYESLQAQMPNSHLFVFAFDDQTQQFLKNLALPNLTIVALSEFEDEELLKIKTNRTMTEYCWTCSPSIVYYVLMFGKI